MSTSAVVAVHLTESVTWVRCGERIVARPAAVEVSGGGVRVAVDPATVESDRQVEPCPIRFVDDEALLLDSVEVGVVDLIADVLADAVTEVGVSTPADLLVLTCPTSWGTRRRRRLLDAGARVARQVRLLSVADCAVGVGHPDDVLVLEVGELESTAAAGGSRAWVADIGTADLERDPATAVQVVRAVQARVPVAPARVVIVGAVPVLSVSELAGEFRERWRVDVRVSAVSARELVSAAHDWGRAGTTVPEPRPARRRWAPATAAFVLGAGMLGAGVLGGAAVWFAAADDRVSSVSQPEPQQMQPSQAPEPARVVSGRVSVQTPGFWHRRDPVDAENRLEFVRDDGAPARIVLVHKELNPGSDLDAVAGALATQIARRSDVFGELTRTDVEGRPALAYLETPDPDSRVRWTVLVVDGVQVSLGCQAPADRLDALGSACAGVLRSVLVAAT